MQDLFVPLAIFNNKPGEDKVILERYEEPAWNNPVVRYFTGDQRELLERKDRVWGLGQHAERMALALEKAGKQTPKYLDIVRAESTSKELKRAIFSMACYWKGEAFFGGLEAVQRTAAGWLEGQEVVEVFYDPKVMELSDLVRAARAKSCANRVWVTQEDQLAAAQAAAGSQVKVERGSPREAKTSDRKFHLRRSPVQYLDLTPLQATRANSLLEKRASVDAILSPVQRRMLEQI